MPILTDRVNRLREKALSWEETQRPYIGRRLCCALQGLTRTDAASPLMKKRAAMLAAVIDGMEPEIHEDELVVGYNYYGSDEGQGIELSLEPREGCGGSACCPICAREPFRRTDRLCPDQPGHYRPVSATGNLHRRDVPGSNASTGGGRLLLAGHESQPHRHWL